MIKKYKIFNINKICIEMNQTIFNLNMFELINENKKYKHDE